MKTTITFTDGTRTQIYSVFGNTEMTSKALFEREQGSRQAGYVHCYMGYTLEEMEAYLKALSEEQSKALAAMPEKHKNEYAALILSKELSELA